MKRVIGILLVALLIITIIAGCGSKGNEPISSEDTPKVDTPKSDTAEEKDEEKAPSEKVVISVFGPSNVEEFPAGQDENNNRIIDFMREQTGYDIKWEIAPKENAREKINLMMTSGIDCPDLIVSGDRQMGLDFIKEGVLHPVDEYVKNTKILLGLLDEDANKMMMHEGQMYAIVVPQNQEATTALITRQDWLDRVGITQLPSTLDEIKAALEAFLKDDPTCMPLTGDGGLSVLTAFRGAFGVVPEYRIDGEVLEPTCITEDMKDLLTYIADLHKNDLLDKEYVVNKMDKVNEKLISGKAGMVSAGWAEMKNRHDALAEKDPEGEFVWIDPVGPDGRMGQAMNPPARIYFYLPIHSKIPQDVINFIDGYVVEETKNVVSYGWEGEHYNIENDLIVATPEAEEIRYRIYYQLWDSKEDFLNRVYLKGFGKDYDAMKPFSTVEDPMWYAPVIPIKQDKDQVLTDLTEQYFIKFITNALPIEKFDEYVEEWKSSGGDEVVEAVNDWYKTTK